MAAAESDSNDEASSTSMQVDRIQEDGSEPAMRAARRWFNLERESQRHWLPKRSTAALSAEESESVVLFGDVAENLFPIVTYVCASRP
mgnify:CR=1 FL=1